MGRPQNSKGTCFHKWSNEEKEYLKQIVKKRHHKEIQKMMSKKFNYQFTIGQIMGAIKRYGLNTGLTGCFPKGHVPFNKGMKGTCAKGCEKGWFKKGNTPFQHKEVGSESIDTDGYTYVKVSEPNEWRLKHQVIWEKHNGKIPHGYAIIFGDRDRTNFDIDNLILVSRKQLAVLNKNKLIQNDANLTRTGLIIADIYKKINEVKSRK